MALDPDRTGPENDGDIPEDFRTSNLLNLKKDSEVSRGFSRKGYSRLAHVLVEPLRYWLRLLGSNQHPLINSRRGSILGKLNISADFARKGRERF